MKYSFNLFCFLLFFAVPSLAADKVHVQPAGYFDNWGVYTTMENDKKVCFMAVAPMHTSVNRENNFLTVTRRPADNQYDVISLLFGTRFHEKSRPTLGVDQKKVKEMKPVDTTAFIADTAVEKELIQQMIAGEVVRTRGKSVKGVVLKETFSLKGFSAAYKALKEACPRQ